MSSFSERTLASVAASWDSKADALGMDEGVNSAQPNRGTHIGLTCGTRQDCGSEKQDWYRTC